MPIPDHVRRALEEYQAAAALARHRAGWLADFVSRGAADLAATGDPDVGAYASRATALATDLKSFAASPVAQVPGGPITVAVLYGPEDAGHAAELVRHFATYHRRGHQVVALPLRLVPLVADRTRAFLPVMSDATLAWSRSADGEGLRARCQGGGCLVVPVYWRHERGLESGAVRDSSEWVHQPQGSPRRGAVERYSDRDAALAEVVSAVTQALGL